MFVVILAVWQILSRRYGAYVLPAPGAVLAGLGTALASGEVWRHTAASLARIAAGFGGALVLSIGLGLAAYLSRHARLVVRDLLAVLNATSVFVWIVLSLIWFGLTDAAPVFTTLMITLPVVASNLVEGIASVDPRLLEMGRAYRLGGRRSFAAIVIPSTVPHLLAGMRVGFGLALKVSVVAEIFGVTSGIGYAMNVSREVLATRMVFAWALVMIAIMFVADTLVFDRLARRLARWR